MKKITIRKGNKTTDILIEKNKYFIGNDFLYKHSLQNQIKNYFSTTKATEYEIENDLKTQLLIDGTPVNIKNTLYVCIDKQFSIADECKLGAKSILMRYYELLLRDEQFLDTLNTITILLDSLGLEITERSIFQTYITPLINKQLIKLLLPEYSKKELQANEYDLEYEEIIILQIEIIMYILNHDSTIENAIIIADLEFITPKIFTYIEMIKSVLVFTSSAVEVNLESLYICQNDIHIDLADDNSIYQKICDNDYKLLNLEEAKMKIKHYVKKQGVDNGDLIKRLLNS